MQKIGMQRSSFASISDLNPLKGVTSYFNSYLIGMQRSPFASISNLNPLKRVNSILTLMKDYDSFAYCDESQSPQTGQFNSYRSKEAMGQDASKDKVSIPSNGSIQFLRY